MSGRRIFIRLLFIFIVVLVWLAFFWISKADSAPSIQAPIIHEVACHDITVVWSDVPEPPVTTPYSGSMYIQKLGEVTEVGTLAFKLFTAGAYYYEIKGLDFEENADYRLNCFLKGAESGGLYWCANGNTIWTPCRKVRIKLPVITKGW